MATYYIGANRGTSFNLGTVSVGTSTTTSDMEVTMNAAVPITKMDLILFLEKVEAYVLSNGLPGGTASIGLDIPPPSGANV